ncbi:MAG: dihydropteroate synthase, partial [Acetatifactor sp.]|nr:dihydropteroate synthase [Acetatifactor sp.]
PIWLDTYKSQVAETGIAVGVDLVNDIWGLKWDERMAQVIADHDVACCLMHNRRRAEPGSVKKHDDISNEFGYGNFLEDVASDLTESAQLARRAGICEDKIILDPGVGFAKSYEQNLEILHHLEALCALGYPILLGASRKSVVGLTLDLPAKERLEGTLVTTVMAVLKGCSFVRVHDIKENVRAIRMTRAVLEEKRPVF